MYSQGSDKKLIYVANARIPTERAHGHQIMKMCEVFADHKIDLQLLVPAIDNLVHKSTDEFDYYGVKKNFVIKKLKCLDPQILLKLPSGIYIKFQLIFFNVSLFFYFLFHRFDRQLIVYTRDEYLLPLLQIFFSKVVWEGHTLPKKKIFYLKYFKRCYKILVLTQQVKNNLIDWGINSKDIFISPDAVDLNIFDINIDKNIARERLSLPKDKIILGYTGSLMTKGMHKGVDVILKSLQILPKNIIFVAVGGNKNDNKIYESLVDDFGLKDRVKILDKVDQNKLAVYQKAFDILLMPFPNKEHFAYFMSPLKMFEYMAAKRPIIASDLPSIREVLNNDNAVFCKPDNNIDLAKKTELVLRDIDLAKKISDRAYQDIKKYTWEQRVEDIINFIKI
jgi:glycosyltransferase involved in cell wall biosynthesis